MKLSVDDTTLADGSWLDTPPARSAASSRCRSAGTVTTTALRDYRCYPLGSDNRIKDVIEFAAASDAAAIEAAERCLGKLRIYAGLELWEGARQVFVRLPSPRYRP
jgi:hypothetical protein